MAREWPTVVVESIQGARGSPRDNDSALRALAEGAMVDAEVVVLRRPGEPGLFGIAALMLACVAGCGSPGGERELLLVPDPPIMNRALDGLRELDGRLVTAFMAEHSQSVCTDVNEGADAGELRKSVRRHFGVVPDSDDKLRIEDDVAEQVVVVLGREYCPALRDQ